MSLIKQQYGYTSNRGNYSNGFHGRVISEHGNIVIKETYLAMLIEDWKRRNMIEIPEYQRPLNDAKIASIFNTFKANITNGNMEHLMVHIVIARHNGRNFILDGQHRMEAYHKLYIRAMKDKKRYKYRLEVPIIISVVRFDSKDDAKAAYNRLNIDRTPDTVTPVAEAYLDDLYAESDDE